METEIDITTNQEVFLNGLKKMFSEVNEVLIVGEGKNGQEEMRLIGNVLGDISVAEKVNKFLGAKKSSEKTLVLSMHNKMEYIYRLMEKDSNGIILKGKSINQLIEAFSFAEGNEINGKKEIDEVFLKKNKAISNKEDLKKIKSLTPRERDIIRLITDGFNTVQIADKLFISKYTVETHRKNILSKLNLNKTTLLVKFAIKNRID